MPETPTPENREHEVSRGKIREASLEAGEYFSDAYFAVRQLCSQALQIHFIHAMRPSDVLEIGIGNGLTSMFLRRAGLRVTTADINRHLAPDVCGSIEELPHLLSGREFDVVVCCEVLEHLPLSDLDGSLRVMRTLGRRLFLTLPVQLPRRQCGFGGFLTLPLLGDRLLSADVALSFKKHALTEQHFWEVNHDKSCSVGAIVGRLRKLYSSVRSGRFALNPYHAWFIAE